MDSVDNRPNTTIGVAYFSTPILAYFSAPIDTMKLCTRARAPLDTATSLFSEYLMAEIATLVSALRAEGYLLGTAGGNPS